MPTPRKRRSPTSKFSFGKRRLEALKPPESGRVYHHDAATPGLALCVTETGAKTFYVVRKLNGRPERIRLGPFPGLTVENARDIAKAIVGDHAKGIDVVAERRQARKVPTLRALFDQWEEVHAKHHRRTFKEDKRAFDKYLAAFHGKPLNRITTGAVATWHGRIGQEHGPIQANRVLGLLSTLFNWSPKAGYDGSNPCKGVKRFRETSRDRFLLPAETKAFFEAVQRQPEHWRDFFFLLLFTGARRSNVAAMAWRDIDFDGRTWRIPRPKNDTPTTLPLTPPALRILDARREVTNGSSWVFPGRKGHIVDARKAWEKTLKDAGLSNLHLHDLRRSLGSWQAALGSSLAIIGASLGHRDLKSTQIYSRLELTPVRESVDKAVLAMQAAGGLLPGPENMNTEVNDDGE